MSDPEFGEKSPWDMGSPWLVLVNNSGRWCLDRVASHQAAPRVRAWCPRSKREVEVEEAILASSI